MSGNKKVLIYGRSLNLEGIGMSLRLEGNLDVTVVESGGQNWLEDNNPEVILFDLADPPKELNLALLQKQPGLMLIGVDPNSDEVLVLTGQRNRIVSACELAQLLSAQANQPATGDEETLYWPM